MYSPQSDLESFSGHIQYPLPNKRATASRIGYGGNAIVFVVFHAGKEFAVKKVSVTKHRGYWHRSFTLYTSISTTTS